MPASSAPAIEKPGRAALARLFGVTVAADWRRPSVLALVLANLAPIFGVLALHWEVFPLIFLFWWENVLVGAFNVLKMATAQPRSPVAWIGKAFVIPFFCVHYGLFTLVHGILVVSLFGGGLKTHAGFPGPATFWHLLVQYDLGWAVLALAVSRGVSFVTNYLGAGEYRSAGLQQLMAQPYGRIVGLHLVVLLGGFLMLALHAPAAGLILLVLVKIGLDLRGHFAERRKFAAAARPPSD